jgi:predicted metalloenzyme YecM
MKIITKILGDPTDFLTKIFSYLQDDNLPVENWELDHICYRVETLERYDFLKKELMEVGELLAVNEIAGRKICTFKLAEPIFYQERKIEIIELPQPKKDKFYQEGFEHIEFVIEDEFETFMNKYPAIKFNIQKMKKEVNPYVKINYEADCTVKFHHHSLEYVVKFLD